jgi:DNA gyrase subunit A
VQICSEHDDVLLTTAKGQCIRFPVTDVRVFKGRDSTGVRGINAGRRRPHHLDGDPASLRRHGDERAAYLKMSRAVRGEGRGCRRRHRA